MIKRGKRKCVNLNLKCEQSKLTIIQISQIFLKKKSSWNMHIPQINIKISHYLQFVIREPIPLHKDDYQLPQLWYQHIHCRDCKEIVIKWERWVFLSVTWLNSGKETNLSAPNWNGTYDLSNTTCSSDALPLRYRRLVVARPLIQAHVLTSCTMLGLECQFNAFMQRWKWVINVKEEAFQSVSWQHTHKQKNIRVLGTEVFWWLVQIL